MCGRGSPSHCPVTYAGTDPPEDFQSTHQGGVTYSFSWDQPANLYNTEVLDYTVSCDPTLEGVPDRTSTTTDTSLTLELGYGLAYSCIVTARNSAGPSDPATPPITIATKESGMSRTLINPNHVSLN